MAESRRMSYAIGAGGDCRLDSGNLQGVWQGG